MSAVIHNAEWHANRAQVVGGSEIAALYHCQQPYQMGLFALWHFKAGNVKPPPVEGKRIDWGNRLEAIIAEWAAHEEGWEITKGKHVRDATTPGLGATLDYSILVPGKNDEGFEGPGALECKNVDWLQHKQKWQDDEPPLHILLQHQHQLASTGYKWGAVAALVGGNELKIYRYHARPALIADIRKRVAAFWRSIEEGKPPKIDGSDSSFHTLRELTPEIVDDAICLDGDNRFPDLCAMLHEASRTKKEAEKLEALLKAELELKLGEHKRGWSDGWSASFTINRGSAGTIVTQDMVGTCIGARKAFRFVSVKEAAK